MNLDELKYREVQKEARKRGLHHKGKKVDLIKSIKKYDMKEDSQEKDVDRVAALEDRFSRVESMLEKLVSPPEQTEDKVPSVDSQNNVVAQPVEDLEEIDDVVEAAPIDIGMGTQDKGMLLNDYLNAKGMSFKELETLVYNYHSNGANPGGDNRIETLDDITSKVDKGVEEAKTIVESGKTKVKLTDIHVVDALQKEFDWKVIDNHGGVHTVMA